MRNFERQADTYAYAFFNSAKPLISTFEKIGFCYFKMDDFIAASKYFYFVRSYIEEHKPGETKWLSRIKNIIDICNEKAGLYIEDGVLKAHMK